MHILVTGGNGQLGQSLKKVTASRQSDTYFFTDVEDLDITNPEALEEFFKSNSIDFCVNCAGYTAVDKAESDEKTAHLINAEAVKNLRRAAENANAYFLHISTDYVFSGKNFRPCLEEDEINPASAYGRSKAEGEKYLMDYPKGIILRTAWLYSEFGANFFKSMIRLTKERDALGVVFDQIGTPTYAGDLAEAIISVIENCKEDKFVPGIFHYTNEGVTSWYDFAMEIARISGADCSISAIESTEYPVPAPRPHYSVLNKKKIKTAYSLSIPYWRDSLIICYEQFKNTIQ